MSIERCRKKLEKYDKAYADEQILEVRDTLYLIAKHQLQDIGEGRHYELIIISSKDFQLKDQKSSQI